MLAIDSQEPSPKGAHGAQAVLHDVNNILSAASSIVGRLKLALGTSSLSDAQALVGQLAGAVEDARSVAHRSQPGQWKGCVDALTYVAEHAGALANLFPQPSSLTLSLCPDPAGASVTMHPTDLLRVITNLVKNSAQVCGEFGVAKVSVATVRTLSSTPVVAGRLQPGNYVAIIVRDSGPGFPSLEARTSTLVEKREPLPRKRLGLAVVRELLQEVGGGLVLGNHPIGGAEAQALLPLAESK